MKDAIRVLYWATERRHREASIEYQIPAVHCLVDEIIEDALLVERFRLN